MRNRTMVLVPVALAVLLAVGGGCSSGGDDDTANDDVATLGASAGTADGGSEDSGGGGRGGRGIDPEFQDAVLEFAQCMRDHGIDMPDPQVTEDGGVLIQAGRTSDGGGPDGEAGLTGPSEAEQEEMEAANEACQSIMEDARGSLPPPDPEQLAEMQDQALEFAECMREHGIDFPDPTFDAEGGRMSVAVGRPATGDGPSFDPNDDDFREAAQECDADGDGGFGFAGPVRVGGGDDTGGGDDGDEG